MKTRKLGTNGLEVSSIGMGGRLNEGLLSMSEH